MLFHNKATWGEKGREAEDGGVVSEMATERQSNVNDNCIRLSWLCFPLITVLLNGASCARFVGTNILSVENWRHFC